MVFFCMKGGEKMRLLKRNKTKLDPITLFLQGNDNSDILAPNGYIKLSQNEEIQRLTYKIADLVSSMTIMLMENRENGDVRIRNQLSRKIDISPNNLMTRKNFIQRIVTEMVLTGNSVVYPVFKKGLLEDMMILNNEKIKFIEQGQGYYIKHGEDIFNSDEVLHFCINPTHKHTFYGEGYTPMIKQTVANLLQANATKTGFLKSKWKPSLIISINSDTNELQDSESRQKILGSYTKTSELGEPWLIPAGELDIKTIQPLTLNDLALQDSITLDIKTLAATFGVPGFMVGIDVFNKEEYNNFISTTIMSIAMNIQQELTKKLLHSQKLYFKFNPKSLMQYNLSEKIEYIKEMVAGGMMNRNEGRCEFDLAPADNVGMNDYIVLENYVPVDKVGEQKKLKGGDEDE